MKFFFLILSFCGAPILAMKRADFTELEEANLDRIETVKIDYSALLIAPPKKARAERSKSAADYEKQHEKWMECADAFDVMGFHIDGYVVYAYKDLMKGIAATQDLKALHFKIHPDDRELRRQLAANYKIHLMPFDDDIVTIMHGLLMRISDEPKLQQAVDRFKVHATTDAIQRSDGTYFPIFVIYCHAGKDAAQYVLNEVYALFRNMRGLNITPRYNRQITSLIYYAQGDGNRKDENYADYYEEGLVHYHPKFEGEIKDYWLKNPAENV